MVATYAVAVFAALFSGCCALTLIRLINHFDPPVAEKPAEQPVMV